jgi:hypothetical protein
MVVSWALSRGPVSPPFHRLSDLCDSHGSCSPSSPSRCKSDRVLGSPWLGLGSVLYMLVLVFVSALVPRSFSVVSV